MMRQCVPVASVVLSASAQLLRSAVRNQFCQPTRTCANDSGGKWTFTTSTSEMGNVAKVSEVVTPKLPPPPPRNAQNRSGFSAADAVTAWPPGNTTDRRRQRVREQARMPGLGAQSAAKGVPRSTDRRADTRRDASACRGQRLVQVPQTGRGRRRDPSAGGVVVDSAGQLTQVEHHGAVRRGRANVGMPATARSDLEIVGSSERHRLLHVRRRCRRNDRRRRRAVVVGVENLLRRCELHRCPEAGVGRRWRWKDLPSRRQSDRRWPVPSRKPCRRLMLPRHPAETSGGRSHAPTSGSRDSVTSRIVNHRRRNRVAARAVARP